uniref:Uncharacterized protein n=1 Tax=Candidatus Kentrum sp. FW TaxID=2126338 RepID=A0A450TW56_9GAMM|nr:MAG: hypothetical protein BECKFW1821C_GA0114237_104724 [Candidatus Kentron sp. FW]
MILGTDGQPIQSNSAVVMANAQGGYRGGHQTRELMSWLPALRSADADLLPDRELLTAACP